MSVKDNYPNLRPSLALNFAQTKTLDPRITFSRASTGTYYDGVTHAKAEENLLPASTELSSGFPTSSNTTITVNAATAPDGTMTAAQLTGTGLRSLTDIIPANTEVTLSMWVKTVSGNTETFRGLTYSGTNGSGFSATIDGTWQRLTLTANSSTFTALHFYLIDSRTSGSSTNIYVWGPQLEIRDSVTAYTATTTQPITNYIPVLQSAAAGEARFDHDPVTGESKGLLIEEQRTNILTYSEVFLNGIWTKSNASIDSNVIVAPDGTLTGDKIISTAVNNSHYVRQTVSSTNGTLSVFAKQGEFTHLKLATNAHTFAASYFNLADGTVASENANHTATITSFGNGWYRCSITPVDAFVSVYIENAGNGANSTHLGDGYSGVYLWGAQLEAAAFPTSYINTTSAQATRSADSASMTGTNFSEWYRQDEGSLYAEGEVATLSPSSNMAIADIGYNSTNRLGVFIDTSGVSFVYSSSNGSNVLSVGSSALASTEYKFAFAAQRNDLAFSENGNAVGTDSDGLLPIPSDSIKIGSRQDTANRYTGTIKKLTYYPLRLTNAQLQALTEG